MGILTNLNTDDANRLVKFLERKGGWLGSICYVVGVVWLALLANVEFNLGTYFSEHALLPGLVKTNFDGRRYRAADYTAELYQLNAKYNGHIPADEFQQLFWRSGLAETEIQNYTISDPISKQDEDRGTNVFAVLRSKRTAGTESLVLNTPYFPGNSQESKKNLAAIGIMFALADFFQNQIYWAKDIVFLISESDLGSLAWVKGHQEVMDDWNNSILKFERVHTKVGNIQAAINFIMDDRFVCTLQTQFHGINGQLPNLDLVNLFNRFVVFDHENRADWPEGDIKKLISFMQLQSTGTPSGSHGYFLKYGIQSITLAGKGGKGCQSFYYLYDDQIATVLETTFRSLNNLLEILHQSFFFYLKTTPSRFISIALYFPPIALILFPIALKGTTIWLTAPDLNITRGLFTIMGLHAVSIFLRWTLNNLQWLVLPYLAPNLEIKSGVFVSICMAFLSCILVVSLILHWNVDQGVREAVYCFGLLELTLGLYCLALFNPGQVVFLGVVASPLATLLFFGKLADKQRFWLKVLVLGVAVGLAIECVGVEELIACVNKYYYESEVFGNFAFDLGWIGGGVLFGGVLVGGLL